CSARSRQGRGRQLRVGHPKRSRNLAQRRPARIGPVAAEQLIHVRDAQAGAFGEGCRSEPEVPQALVERGTELSRAGWLGAASAHTAILLDYAQSRSIWPGPWRVMTPSRHWAPILTVHGPRDAAATAPPSDARSS